MSHEELNIIKLRKLKDNEELLREIIMKLQNLTTNEISSKNKKNFKRNKCNIKR